MIPLLLLRSMSKMFSQTRTEPEIVVKCTRDTLWITVSRETCTECGEPVRVHNYSPTDGDASCACCVEGPEACAATDMQGDVRSLLVAAIAQIDARNGAPSECEHDMVVCTGSLTEGLDIPHCLRCKLPLRLEVQEDGTRAYVITTPRGGKVAYTGLAVLRSPP